MKRNVYAVSSLGHSINNPLDEVYRNDCLFRGALNHTMRMKPHYRLRRGLWVRSWCQFVYDEFNSSK